MFDSDAVIADMRKIFSKAAPDAPVATPAAKAPATVDPVPTAPSPRPPRASLFNRIDGIATIGFAVVVAMIGIVAVPLMQKPASLPPAAAVTAPDLSTPAPAFTVDHAIAPPPAGSLPASIVSESIARSAVHQGHRPRRIHRSRRPARIHRQRITRLEAPHLTGEALRQALAEDAVITRHLNVEALRKLPPPSDRRGNS